MAFAYTFEHEFPVDKIWVRRDQRIRRVVEEDAIAEKAESMKRLGLIHPIVIKRDGELIAGETRWNAALRLGWTTIPVKYQDELDPETLISIELEENVKRRDLPWQDQCDALRRFHEMKKSRHPDWTHEDTAEAIGYSRANVTKQLSVAEALAGGEERVVAAKEFSVALGIVKRQSERRAADEAAKLISPDAPKPESPIINADFLEWVKTYDGPPFNLIHCDFPYGIGADGFNQGSAETRGGYADDFNTYAGLCQALALFQRKLMGESCHVLFWFSMKHYAWTLNFLQSTLGLWVDPYPLIWFKSDNTGTLPDPQRGPRRVYETAFLASHGDRKILQAVGNTFAAPVTRLADHMSEKSEDMLAHFFRMLVDGNTRLLDPTCGSGSALRGARRLGAAYVIGLERDTSFALAATQAWEAGQ